MKFFFLVFFVIFSGCSQLPSKRSDKLSILQGVTNSKEVEFSVVAEKGRELRFELRDEEGQILTPEEIKVVSRDFSDHVIHKILFTRNPAVDYNFIAFEGDKAVDQRLVGRGQREESRLRLAVVSCIDDYYEKQFKIWNALAAHNPEYVLLLGDNVYADKASPTTAQATDPEVLWKRYIDVRLSIPFFFLEKLIPSHALWDDHDYGTQDGGAEYRHKEASKEIFEAFYAQDLSDDDWTKGYGVGGHLSLGDFNLYFLDGRYFRSPPKEGTQLGLDQTAWLYSKIREEVTPSFIIKGDQFFGGYHEFDSFEGHHPEEFKEFAAELKKTQTPFVFLSGDRHMSEIMQFPRGLFGKPSFEITSSPIHARTFDNTEKNPWRVVAVTGESNFLMVENLAKDNHWFMDVESVGVDGNIHFRRELAVYIKDLQDNLKETRKRRHGKRRYRRIKSRRGRRR